MRSDEINEKSESFFYHLNELRDRLVKVAFAVVLGFLICYSQSEKIFNFIRAPIQPYLGPNGLIFTAPVEKFMAHIKVSFVFGFILALPYVFLQVWKFISPALHLKEKRYALGFILSGVLLFICGLSFTYFLVLPMAFHFLLNYGGDTDKALITIDHYFDFIIQMSLVFGLAFELPLVISILGAFGLVDTKFLREKRRFAIIIISVISALVTPPDIVSMLLMLVPMLGLYEISIWVVYLLEKKRKLNII